MGSIDEETGEELRYEDCTSGYESYDNIQMMGVEPISVMLRSLYGYMSTIVSILSTCKLTVPLHPIMDCYFPLLEMEHLP